MSDTITLEGWRGPWPDDDKDANLKADIALYAAVDPLRTVRGLSDSIDVPVGRDRPLRAGPLGQRGRLGPVGAGPDVVAPARRGVHRLPRPPGRTRLGWPPTTSCGR